MGPDDGATHTPAIRLRIWGVRGSYPTPVAANLGHGGNTACLQIEVPNGDTILFDSGTGIHQLGRKLAAQSRVPRPIHIFFTHFHWDHIQGLLGFPPLFSPRNTLTFYSSQSSYHLRRVLHGQMVTPYFPIEFDFLNSTRTFVQVAPEGINLAGLSVAPFALNHPGGATGYRISRNGSVIVYATDHEHGNADVDANLLKAARNADVLIYDAQYTPEAYTTHIGWGHSTWLEATKLARRANVKQLVLFHHDPNHDDATMTHIVAQAREHFPNTIAATEDTTLDIG
jgi:phosphoribosyl 1,2-cyclic phosphodiesterase